jgi:hypothetical protein
VTIEHTKDEPKYWSIVGNILKQEVANDKK